MQIKTGYPNLLHSYSLFLLDELLTSLRKIYEHFNQTNNCMFKYTIMKKMLAIM